MLSASLVHARLGFDPSVAYVRTPTPNPTPTPDPSPTPNPNPTPKPVWHTFSAAISAISSAVGFGLRALGLGLATACPSLGGGPASGESALPRASLPCACHCLLTAAAWSAWLGLGLGLG